MERTKQWILVLALILGLALCFSATAGAQETLKIGMVAPFSGPGAPWGAVWKKTALLEQEKINAAGGLPVGGKNYKLEFIFEDDKFTCEWTYGIPHQGLSPFYFTEVRNGENVCLEVKDVRWVEALTRKYEEEAPPEK